MATHQFPKFGSHRHGGSGDIMTLGSHVISQDHVIKVHVNLSYHPAKFGGYRHYGSEDAMILVCDLIL